MIFEVEWKRVILFVLAILIVGLGMFFSSGDDDVLCGCVNETIIKEVVREVEVCSEPKVVAVAPVEEVVELSSELIASYKSRLPGLVSDTECWEGRLDVAGKPENGFFEFAKSPPVVLFWGGSEFVVESEFELMRIGKRLDKRVHRLRYDVLSERLISCDGPVTFPYGDWPLMGKGVQKTPKSW